jgi:nucleotide-binding universal stress UspA family protein
MVGQRRMFTSILCPIDFSEFSTSALDYAIALAAGGHGRITLIHVADLLLVEAAAAAYDATYVRDEAERELRSLASSVAATRGADAPQIDILVSIGDPASEIAKTADDRGADSIVMGTQGLSGFKKMFFGSVTEHVLRQARVPVLAVPTGERGGGADALPPRIGRIMAPVDFTPRSADDVHTALDLAKQYAAPLLIVHVVSSVRGAARWRETLSAHERVLLAKARTQMDAFAAALGGDVPVETLVTTGSPADEIGSIAAERRVGLIVMGLAGSPGSPGARPGSVAYRVLSLAAAPVLALPPPPAQPSR